MIIHIYCIEYVEYKIGLCYNKFINKYETKCKTRDSKGLSIIGSYEYFHSYQWLNLESLSFNVKTYVHSMMHLRGKL